MPPKKKQTNNKLTMNRARKKNQTDAGLTMSQVLPDLAPEKTKAAEVLERVVRESKFQEIVGLEKESIIELLKFIDICMSIDTPSYTSGVFIAFQTLDDGERARLTESFSHTQLAQIGIAACLIAARRNTQKPGLSDIFKRFIDEKNKEA